MENINLEFYKVFYFVAKTKNITRTSEILLISQPAITQTIKKLEDQLSYKLFFRTSRGMELTKCGEELYNNIKDAIECLINSKKSLDIFNNNIIKTLRIGGGVTLLKHNALEGFKKFRDRNPNIKLEIVKGITSELINKLNNNSIDLVLFNMPLDLNENINYEVIEDIHDTFVANSKTFDKFTNKKINKEEFENMPFVLQSNVSTSRKFLDSLLKKNKITIHNIYELESYDLVNSFVKAGLGVGFLNRNHIENELKSGELFELNIDIKIPPRKICIAYNKKNVNNKKLKEFIDLVSKNKESN